MICSTYAYRGDGLEIGGDRHKAYLMASTTFDGSGATNFWISLIRAVCANTIRAGLAASKGATVKIRHNAKLDPDKVRESLLENVRMFPVDNVRIEPMDLGERAGVMGALALAIRGGNVG